MKSKLILVTVLLLPTLIYIYFALGVPKAVRAPFFGPRHAIEVTDKNGNPKTDTAWYTIPAFHGLLKNGAAFNSNKLAGHLYLAIFLHPDSVNSVLPLLAQDVTWNKSKYGNAVFVFFFPGDSAGNPQADAPDFAKDLKLGTDTGMTIFVPPVTFDTLRDKHYFVPDPSRKKDPWVGKSDAVLIDWKGRIRGYYNIHYGDQLKKMREDVQYIYSRDEAAETLEQTTIEKKK